MFRKASPNLVESDEGFSVEVLGRSGILYREGEHSMLVYAELAASKAPAGILVWRDSVKKWQPPYDQDSVTDEKRTVIVENIRSAIQFSGGDIEVIG